MDRVAIYNGISFPEFIRGRYSVDAQIESCKNLADYHRKQCLSELEELKDVLSWTKQTIEDKHRAAAAFARKVKLDDFRIKDKQRNALTAMKLKVMSWAPNDDEKCHKDIKSRAIKDINDAIVYDCAPYCPDPVPDCPNNWYDSLICNMISEIKRHQSTYKSSLRYYNIRIKQKASFEQSLECFLNDADIAQ